jgi:hypothetical protein
MKNFIIILLFASIVSACNNTAKELKERIADADSIAINFYKDNGKMDTVTSVEIIRDKKEIEKLTEFITAENASEMKNCDNNGSIHFFKNDAAIQDIFFNRNNEGCHRFQFMINHKLASTSMNREAQSFLSNIQLHLK